MEDYSLSLYGPGYIGHACVREFLYLYSDWLKSTGIAPYTLAVGTCERMFLRLYSCEISSVRTDGAELYRDIILDEIERLPYTVVQYGLRRSAILILYQDITFGVCNWSVAWF